MLASQPPPRSAPTTYTGQQRRSFYKGDSKSPYQFSSTGSSRPVPKRFRSISSEEYRKHIAAGTCFKCGLKFGPAHRCPPKTLNVLVCEDEDPAFEGPDSDDHLDPNSEVELQLSELSSNGLDSSYTLKLFGAIGDHKVKVMVDSVASHCFISDHLATLLQLQVTPTTPYSVMLGDGSKVRAAGICHAVPLQLASEVFHISCYVFPLCSIDIDVILGITWLASLGDVTANWQRLTMKFSINGRPLTIQGDPTLTRRACSPHDIHQLEAGDSCWVLRSMETDATNEEFGLGESLPPLPVPKSSGSWPNFRRSFAQPPDYRQRAARTTRSHSSQTLSLSPSGRIDKDEMERLVTEMLASGVIQASTSPYSSPVLLVWKKDGSWRFCVDYRELNKRTVPDKYPIPVIQE